MTTFHVAILRGDALPQGGIELLDNWTSGSGDKLWVDIDVLGIMATIASAMLAWFYKKGWLRGNDAPSRRHHGSADRP